MSNTADRSSELPAFAGASPAKSTPFGRASRYGAEEMRQLQEALDQGTLFYAQGRKVRELEEAFAAACGTGFAVACSSGTAAIHAALIALGIGPGDEVITGPVTDMGTLIPILYQGAIPVFADLDAKHCNLDPASVEANITEQTRAVIAIHLGGNPSDLCSLVELCEQRGLALVEDCAQAMGARYQGRGIGTFGQIGCFSLNEYKQISCGDGGLAITNDPGLAERLRLATDKAYSRKAGAANRQPAFLANNYRMTELQGAVAVAQLAKLPSIVDRRRAWCEALREELRDVPGLIQPASPPGGQSSWWFYMMRVQPELLGADASTFARALVAEGLPVGSHYIGQCVYEYPVFTQHSAFSARPGFDHPYSARAYGHGLCPEAEKILDTCVILSVNEAYTSTDLRETVHSVRRVATWFRAGRERGSESSTPGKA